MNNANTEQSSRAVSYAEQQAKQAAYENQRDGARAVAGGIGEYVAGSRNLYEQELKREQAARDTRQFAKPQDEGDMLRVCASLLANSLEALEERLNEVDGKLFPRDSNGAKHGPCEVASTPALAVSIERAQNTASRMHNILNSITERL
jgi:hypothetical protein